MKLVIGLVGLGGTGKGEVVKLLRERARAVDIELRKIVEVELARAKVSPSNSSLREMSTSMREEFGADIFAQRSIGDIRAALVKHDVVVVDSIKSPEEVAFLRRELPVRFVLLCVTANSQTRFQRLRARGRLWDVTEFGDFEWRDRMEGNWGVREAMKIADFRIVNDGSLDSLSNKVTKFLSGLGLVEPDHAKKTEADISKRRARDSDSARTMA